MLPSVREVAEVAGVSVGTVSHFLNHRDKVSDETAARVERAIETLGFVPNGAARQLRAGRSQSLGLVVLDAGNPFFMDVAQGAESRAQELGLSLLVANSASDTRREEVYVNLFDEQRVAGIMVSPMAAPSKKLIEIQRRGTPVVIVDRVSQEGNFPSVSVDDTEGGRLATLHLLESGRRRVAFVGGPLEIRQVADRFRGSVSAVREFSGAQVDLFETRALSFDEGRRVGALVAQSRTKVKYDAVFAANDLLAIGVLQALFQADKPIRVPDDIALVGYDDIDFASAAVVPITSIRQPRELIGSTAVDLLTGNGDRASDSLESKQVVFQPELVVRESSGSPKGV